MAENSPSAKSPNQVVADGSPNPIVFDAKKSRAIKRIGLREVPHSAAALKVFGYLVLIVVMSILLYGILVGLVQVSPEQAERFSATVIGPLITILASASGYYFASRSDHRNGS